tara:strand:- start:72 stop:398 length:327 start_codon:yes stop_codon:yes gene_type:complete
MTKKIFLISILLCFSYLGFTQTTPEEKAKKVTSEIAKVLSLNEVQKEEVYTVQLNRFIQVAEISENDLEFQIKKEMKKKVLNKLHGKMLSIIGKEKMQRWSAYKKNKK